MISVGVITISDRASKGVYEDLSGPKIREIISRDKNFEVRGSCIVPDEECKIVDKLKYMTDNLNLNIIFTTGGTGVGMRDVTPEATKKIIDKELPGISEFIRQISMKYSDNAMLSRGIAGISNKTFIINLPGKPAAIEQVLTLIIPALIHGIGIAAQTLEE